MEKSKYYQNEINKINFHSIYCPILKIQGGEENQATKWLDINQESAKVLIKKLKKEFNIK